MMTEATKARRELAQKKADNLKQIADLLEDIKIMEQMLVKCLPPAHRSPLEREWALLAKERNAFDREVQAFRR